MSSSPLNSHPLNSQGARPQALSVQDLDFQASGQSASSQALSMRRLSLPLNRDELRTLRAGDACLLTGPLFTLRDAGHIRLLDELDQAQGAQGASQAQGAQGAAQAQGASQPQTQAQDSAQPQVQATQGDASQPQTQAQGAQGASQAQGAQGAAQPQTQAQGAARSQVQATQGDATQPQPQTQAQDNQAQGAAPTQPQDILPYGLSGQTIFYAGPTPAAAGRPFGAIGPTTASRMDFAAPALYRAGILATIGKGARSEAVHEACRETGSVYFVATGGAAAFLARCIESSQTLGYDDLGTEALRRIEVKDFPVFVGIDTSGNDMYSL